ncbi:MAG: hypothetical protein K0S98_833 [Propionibacteriaceae bacterium]|nr:hypothetical protein [Propionibacteriaceae bacterium]
MLKYSQAPVGPVEVAAASLGIVGLTSGGRYECEPTRAARSPRGSSTKASVAPSGLTPLEEVIAARVVRNAPHGAAFDRRNVAAVVGAQVDQAALGVEGVVVLIGGRSSIGTGYNLASGLD